MTSPAQQAAAGDGTARGGDDVASAGDVAGEGDAAGASAGDAAGARAGDAAGASAGASAGDAADAVHGRRAATGRRAAGRASRTPRVLTTSPLGLAVELGERRAALARSRARASVLPSSRRSSFVASEPLVRAACGPEPVAAAPAAATAPTAPVPAAPGPEASVAPAPSVAPARVTTATRVSSASPSDPSAPSPSHPLPGTSDAAPALPRTRRRRAGSRAGRTGASGVVVAGRTGASGVVVAGRTGASGPAVPLRDRALSVARKSVLVAAAVGLAASTVLPLLGGAGDEAQAEGTSTPWHASGGQHVTVAGGVTEADATRDAYGATSLVDLATQDRRNATAALHTEYTGPTTSDYLASPLYDTLDRDQVLAVALQYLGTPYVHGGEDPSAFDCSGLVTFVYAQFGVDLVHYVPTQAAQGRVVPASEAVPGDLVVFDDLSHDGIYAGDGMILDAPRPGGFVDVRPIWDKAHHFVRIDG